MAKDYDPKQVTIVVGGHIVEGYADGTFASLERSKDAYALTVGAGGEGARAKSNDKSGELTITLLQSSKSNDVLSGYATADEISNSGQVPAFLKDNNGTTLAEAVTAWVKKKPTLEYGNEITNRVWVISSDNWDILAGGID